MTTPDDSHSKGADADHDPPTDRVGEVIDSRYRITGVLGEGSMGTVYRAEHLGIRRAVALKLLHPNVASLPEIMQRFEREAYATGRIDHPNCVTISDFGKLDDGSLFLVMELLEGRQLSDLLEAEHRLSVGRAMHIVRHILRGLAHAHRAGIVHRDVKPENVTLVEHEGDADFAKILDFGLAKLVGAAAEDDGKRLTRVGLTFGTPAYMSPEQAIGQDVDARTDLYAVSIILYEMIAGRPPFVGADPLAVLPMHMSCEVPPLSEVAPEVEVPVQLEQLIRYGLAKRRDERIASAKDYLSAINEITEQEHCERTPRPEIWPSASTRPKPAPRRPGGLATVPTIYTTQTGTEPFEQASPSSVPPSANARRLVMLGGAIATVLLVIVFTLVNRSKSVDIAAEARGMIEQGHPAGAIAYLEAKQEAIEGDADALLVLGHAHVELTRYTKALGIYRRAISLSPQLGSDDVFRSHIGRMLDSRKLSVGQGSIELLELLIVDGNNDDARQILLAAASTNKRLSTRQSAVTVAEKLGLGEQIDRVSSYSLDLEQGRNCAKRKSAVAKLHALGDPRSIATLKKARRRMRNGKNTNACLREEANSAIESLEGL